MLAQADRLDDRTAVAPLDGDRHLGAFLQFLGLEAVRQRLAVGAQDLDVFGDLHRTVLPAGMEEDDAFLRVHLVEDARCLEGQGAAAEEHQPEDYREKYAPHGFAPAVEG